jgi:hypothetical protein
MGAIVTLLPEIQGLQRQGHKTRAIWESLTNDGFQMTNDLFRLYLSRARRKMAQFNGPTLTAPPEAGESSGRSRETLQEKQNGRTLWLSTLSTDPVFRGPIRLPVFEIPGW